MHGENSWGARGVRGSFVVGKGSREVRSVRSVE